jgi:hypothetical protein
MEVEQVTPEERSALMYTIEHFKEIARQNRFAENRAFGHETDRCLICHPELCPVDPLVFYLKVVTESIKVRRPRLDQSLVDDMNHDLELMGESERVSREALMEGDPKALACWSGWVREALGTGLGLLSVHSSTSREFTLEEADMRGLGHIVEVRVKEIMAFQKQNAS